MDDKSLRNIILEELDWDPSFDSADIGVQVSDGVVTLTGHVGSYAEKIAVERACARVKGVKAIAQDIEIRLPCGFRRTSAPDSEMSSAPGSDFASAPDSEMTSAPHSEMASAWDSETTSAPLLGRF